MKRPVFITFAIVVAATIVGWRNHSELAIATQALEKARHQARLLGIAENSPQGTSLRTRSRQQLPTDIAATARSLIEFAREIEHGSESSDTALLDDRDQRMLDWQRRLLALEADEMNRLIAEISETTDLEYEGRRQLLLMVFETFAQSHPGPALDAIATSPDLLADDWDRAAVVTAALVRGMETDPAISTDWWKKHSDLFPSESRQAVTERLIGATSLLNPKTAFQLIGNLGNLDPDYAVGMITNSARTDEQRAATLAAFRDYLITVEDPKLRKTLHWEGISSMISSALHGGVDHAIGKIGNGSFTPDEIEAFAARTIPSFNEGDAPKWIDWLAKNIPEETVSKQVIPGVFFEWAGRDYQAAGEWLTQLEEGPVKISATNVYAYSLADHYPDDAARWALTLPSGENRDFLLPRIYGAWKKKDPAAAAVFAEQNGIPK
ncbi:MAG: hypothetical protein EOP88_01970 [Verrucomicrobiaceae bacterium]|nr:MAG: hypothetical protein EOP88_01970 [Verrucomicrobiaceae bacterium]